MISLVTLLAANLAFQAPLAAPIVEVAGAPIASPRSIAERNPNLTDEVRGDIMMARKMYRDAIDFYKPTANKSAVLANKTGIAYHQLGDLNNAKKFYERAVKLDRNYAEAQNNLGTIHYAQKSYNNAIKQYEKALALTPGAASVWTNLGTAYFARKRYDEAVRAYQYALQLDPDVFDRRGSNGVLLQERSVEEKALFYYTLAKTYAQAGDVERTIRYVRFALENGFKQRNKFTEEPEFAQFKENMEFQKLLSAEQSVL
ncbi:MAG: tetratricopeptide repeat protein [Acidobacteriota bacterium]